MNILLVPAATPRNTSRCLVVVLALVLSLVELVASQTEVREIVDGSDARIRYTGQWVPLKGRGQAGNTLMLTKKAGSAAFLSFTGVGISVFGAQGPGPGNTTSTYSVDGNSPSVYMVPEDIKMNQLQVPFFRSLTLENGQHDIVVTNLNDQAWYWLDYFEVTSAPLAPAASSASLSSSTFVSIPAATSTVISASSAAAILFSAESALPIPTSSPISSSSFPSVASSGEVILTTATLKSSPGAQNPVITVFSTTILGDQIIPTASVASAGSSRSHLSSGAVAGITISVLLLVASGLGALWWWFRRRQLSDGSSSARTIEPFTPMTPPRGPVIHGASAAYTVEHFNSGSDYPPEKFPTRNTSEMAYVSGTQTLPFHMRRDSLAGPPSEYNPGRRSIEPSESGYGDAAEVSRGVLNPALQFGAGQRMQGIDEDGDDDSLRSYRANQAFPYRRG